MAKKYYLDGRVFKPRNGVRVITFAGQEDPVLLNDIVEEILGTTLPINYATTTVPGIVELATDAEAIAGTSTTLVITPASLAAAMASIGDLESVLTNGNTTGANDISIDSGQVLKATVGGGQLDLSYGGADTFSLSTDSAGGTQAYVTGSTFQATVGFGNFTNLISREIEIFMQSSASEPVSYLGSTSTGVFDSLVAVPGDVCLSVINTGYVSPYLNTVGTTLIAMINTGNTVASTFTTGVSNSVIVGGDGITAKTNNTAYVNQLGFCEAGGSFEAVLTTNSITVDRTYTLPNNSGTVDIINTVFANTPVTAATGDVILVDATGGNIAINIPSAALGDNQKITVKKIDASANVVSLVHPIGNIDGQITDYDLTTVNSSVTIVSNSGNWYVIAVV